MTRSVSAENFMIENSGYQHLLRAIETTSLFAVPKSPEQLNRRSEAEAIIGSAIAHDPSIGPFVSSYAAALGQNLFSMLGTGELAEAEKACTEFVDDLRTQVEILLQERAQEEIPVASDSVRVARNLPAAILQNYAIPAELCLGQAA